jgi:hypothetical protein
LILDIILALQTSYWILEKSVEMAQVASTIKISHTKELYQNFVTKIASYTL